MVKKKIGKFKEKPVSAFPLQPSKPIKKPTATPVQKPISAKTISLFKKYYQPKEIDTGMLNRAELKYKLTPYYRMLYLLMKGYMESKTMRIDKILTDFWVNSTLLEPDEQHLLVKVDLNEKSIKMLIHDNNGNVYGLFRDPTRDFYVLSVLFIKIKTMIETEPMYLNKIDLRSIYHGFQYVIETNYIQFAQILGEYETDLFKENFKALFERY